MELTTRRSLRLMIHTGTKNITHSTSHSGPGNQKCWTDRDGRTHARTRTNCTRAHAGTF